MSQADLPSTNAGSSGPCAVCGAIYKLVPSLGTLRKHGHGGGNPECPGTGRLPKSGSGQDLNVLLSKQSDTLPVASDSLSTVPNLIVSAAPVRQDFAILQPTRPLL